MNQQPDSALVQQLQDKLNRLTPEVLQGSAPPEVPVFNPDEYQLPTEMEHMYRRAKWELVEGEYRLVVAVFDYLSVSRSWSVSGYYPETIEKGRAHPLAGQSKNLAGVITQMESSPEGWRLHSVHANGAGQGVALFRRVQKLVLVTPPRLDATTEVTTEVTPEVHAAAAAEWEKANAPEQRVGVGNMRAVDPCNSPIQDRT
jgi:hypothetical protein